jgi:hypothetical protein
MTILQREGQRWLQSCRTFAANAVRLQLHALAYNLGNFLRTLAATATVAARQASALVVIEESWLACGAYQTRVSGIGAVVLGWPD